jgi:MerR family transcriptional regulator, redox-sensitive transcriptional activator SoxR
LRATLSLEAQFKSRAEMDRFPELTIGEVARRAGVATSVLRYYERIGLLPAPDRVGGQRRYDAEVLGKLGFISVAQNAGFKLREIKELLDDSSGAGDLGASMRTLSTQKLDEVEALLEQTKVMKTWLEKAKDCGCSTPEECALFPAAGESHPASDLALRVVELDATCRRPDDVIPMPTVPPSLRPG